MAETATPTALPDIEREEKTGSKFPPPSSVTGSYYFVAWIRDRVYMFLMKTVIHLTRDEEAKALPILLRNSPGMILPQGTYVLSETALGALRNAGIRFTELSREAVAPSLEEVAGEGV